MYILIPNQFGVSPRNFGEIENDWTRFSALTIDECFITADGHEWLAMQKSGLTIDQIDSAINQTNDMTPNGIQFTRPWLRYSRGAIELFFKITAEYEVKDV